MTVRTLAQELDVWGQVEAAVLVRLSARAGRKLLLRLGSIPIQRSRAVRRLGSYVSRAGSPVCIRLQFAQEDELLVETFLHEVAHACDHLSRKRWGTYRQAHGSSWRAWALELGIAPQVKGRSEKLDRLYHERLKVVAVCTRCGFELRRLRRLNRQHSYTHTACGGILRLC